MSTPSSSVSKKIRLSLVAIIACTSAHMAHGQSLWNAVFNVATDTNWSTTANWTSTPPGPSSAAYFGDATATTVGDPTITSVVDAGFTASISGLFFTNQTLQQNLLIANGVTLNITGAGGLSATNFNGVGTTLPVTTVSGPGAAIVINNAGAGVFCGVNGTSAAEIAKLDLSGLDKLTLTGSKMMSGVGLASTQPRCAGILSLAKTNFITLTGGNPQLDVGDNSQNIGAASTLNLGQTNVIFADTLGVGINKQGGNGTIGSIIQFNSLFTANNPVAYFRGHDGVSAMNTWSLADSLGNTGSSVATVATVDFTGGTVNALVNSIWLGKVSPASPASPKSTATLTFESGVINVNNLTNALALTPSTGGPPNANGTVNVNSSVNGTATLVVNNTLVMAARGSSGTSTGTLNINGGTVQANNIIAGAGGNSTITLNFGTLIVTNSAGAPGQALSTVTLGGGGATTLQLGVSGTVAEVNVTNLNVNGPVTVNIASLPVITSYSKQFPLISYVSFPGTFNFTLGSLPVGSPAFQGYISNNVTGNSIDLVLTSGPVVSSVFKWTGAANSNWDLISLDWTLSGPMLAYSNTSLVLFDDSSAVTNVNLTQSLLPGSVTVSNNVDSYTFLGTGAIAGSSGLIKSGTGTLVVANTGTNQFSGSVTINNGTLQFGNGGSGGNLPSGDAVTDNGSLVFDLNNKNSVFGAISGTGSLAQNGSGVLSLSASNSYSGFTTVSSGTLMVDGSINGSGSVTNAAGAVLGGNGTIVGALTSGGQISPGDVNGIGTLTTSNNVTLLSGGTLRFDLNSADGTVGSGINDLLQIGLGLTVNNNTIGVDIQGIPSQGLSYTVITCSGSPIGTFNPTVVGTHYAATVDSTSLPGNVLVNITGSTGADVKWNSTTSGVWDNGTSNWFNLDSPQVDFFGNGDTALFDDSVAGAQTNISIANGVVIAPLAWTNTGAFNYTISGGGTVTGPTSLLKDGSGTLTINTTNGFTGGTVIVNGKVVLGSGTALGPALATTSITVSNAGTMDINGMTVKNQHEFLSGAGVGGNGAVVNSGAAGATIELVTLNGDTTFGGGNDWRVANQTTGLATMNTAGSPVNLTKIGTNQLILVGCNTTDPNIENLNIVQGSVLIQGTGPQPSTQFGDPNGIITVSSNANLQESSPTVPITKNFVLNDGGILWTIGPVTNIGTLTLTNNASNTGPGTGIITNTSGSFLDSQTVIVGPGNLLKTGSGTTLLESINTYTGNTTISAGTVAINDTGAITNSAIITIASGATVDVSARTDDTLELALGQTLNGAGRIRGSLTEDAGATVNPGSTGTTGALTVTNAVTLGGTTVMDVDGVAATNDVITGAQSIAYGGTLTVNLVSAPSSGQTFLLFSAAGYGGIFAHTNLPALAAGLSWNTANLGLNGTISVTGSSGPTTNASITKVTLSGTNVLVHGTNNNVPNTSFHYVVLTTPNITNALSNWTPVVTNPFNPDGTFDYTNPIVPGTPRQFIDVKAVP